MRIGHKPLRRRGFTAMELLIVLMIMSIVAVLGVDTIASFEANYRAERAARETLAYFRYARHLALTTGKDAKVQFDTVNNTVAVYWMSNGSTWDAAPVAHAMASGKSMLLNYSSTRELTGTTFTLAPNSNTAFIFGPLGSCGSPGSITFSYATNTKRLTVPAVGDPALD